MQEKNKVRIEYPKIKDVYVGSNFAGRLQGDQDIVEYCEKLAERKEKQSRRKLMPRIMGLVAAGSAIGGVIAATKFENTSEKITSGSYGLVMGAMAGSVALVSSITNRLSGEQAEALHEYVAEQKATEELPS